MAGRTIEREREARRRGYVPFGFALQQGGVARQGMPSVGKAAMARPWFALSKTCCLLSLTLLVAIALAPLAEAAASLTTPAPAAVA